MLGRLTSIVGFPLDAVLILLGIFYVYRAKIISRQSKMPPIETDNDADVINPSISKIITDEPSNKLSVLQIIRNNWIPLTLTAAVPIWAIIEIILWIIHKVSFNPIGLFLFIGCYLLFPSVIWYDTLFVKRKQMLTGKSKVFQSISFTYKSDNVKKIFNRCYKALDIMKAEPPTQMDADLYDSDKPILIKRPIGNFIMIVGIKHEDNNNFTINVSSDAKRLEVEFDFGKNKRNINTFKKLMLSKNLN
jgi:hypothetical protein